ncbi:cation:proton antiporter [Ruegeria sp. WL0004]|uniref:Cation:proton antiporter n=1 Tax=Ruegeria marisflavi TaxID=2984152 RepID=A0ABT2WNU7_9RHOB|nr:cation:proton antiporter [Ruegeria sp. WL0004]MCU9837511.1 cation:proton antiporter [Ruegeria sp. WL0004]
MQGYAPALIALGVLFLVGLAADGLGRRTNLPRVTLLLACGLLGGKAGFNLIPDGLRDVYPIVSVIALSMVAFLLGGELSFRTLRCQGRAIVTISLAVVFFTLIAVSTGLAAIGVPLAAALMIGALATATDPAATLDVIHQSGTETEFSRTLKGIVAIDDAWGVMVFALLIVVARAVNGADPGLHLLTDALVEIFGSMLLGCVIGVPAAYLTGRLSDGEPLRIEALGVVFLTAGCALWLDLSYLIAGMTAGAVIVNLARHHTMAFREIENLEWPFMIIFFILAGATLEPAALWAIGPVGLAYCVLRILGRIAGGWLGGMLARTPRRQRSWYGPALLPQAGVAIGMALMAAEYFPEHGDMITALAIAATVTFELIGPILASFALRKAG